LSGGGGAGSRGERGAISLQSGEET
jgi:hypothetical protein